MKTYNKVLSLLLIGAFSITSCDVFEVDNSIDPNRASLESIQNNPTQNQVNFLAVGVQADMRSAIGSFYLNTGTVGREVINSASTDNRFYTELLGTQVGSYNGANDPAGIFNGYYTSFSQTRRRAEVFTRSAETSVILTTAQKAGIRGFARTIQAYASLNLLNMQYTNGIRESFSDLTKPGDLLKPGPFGTYASGLTLIKGYLDEGATALAAAGSSFAFPMTDGWDGFDTPASFLRFNRALAARVAMYQQDWTGVLTALNGSFLDMNGLVTTGPIFEYSTAPGDQTNTLWHVHDPTEDGEDNNAPYVIFDNFISDAEAGDARLSKAALRFAPRQSGVVTSAYEATLYASNTSPISIIRNEELILMNAEARIQTNDFIGAAAALNKIRTSAGLQPLAIAKPGVDTKDEYIDELLNQRRYSLFWEGHRWFDMRRYNKIGSLPLQGTVDGNSYTVFTRFSRPDSEVQWDRANPN
jgi:starch-binding outer membrane protein, SusD/RagB family